MHMVLGWQLASIVVGSATHDSPVQHASGDVGEQAAPATPHIPPVSKSTLIDAWPLRRMLSASEVTPVALICAVTGSATYVGDGPIGPPPPHGPLNAWPLNVTAPTGNPFIASTDV